MCGIVGYIGKRDAVPILVEGLRRLEYRGYDSSGIGVVFNGSVHLRKRAGKILSIIEELKNAPLPTSKLGIAHVRWATHGEPNRINAHPHIDCSNKILVVHNGIIENYQRLKASLMKRGHIFKSETDTEVIAHLIEENLRGNLEEAVRKTMKLLEGAYAIGVVSCDEPGKLIGARNNCPLVVGIGKNENFIASDIPAILQYTRTIIHIEDKEVVSLTDKDIRISHISGKRIDRQPEHVNFDISAAEKAGFSHFMLKEIYEQPTVISRIISLRISKKGDIVLEGLNLSDRALKKIDNIIIVACGTAYHAGIIGKYLIEDFARLPVWVDLSSEFRYRKPVVKENTLIIAISQSGETADTLAAVREAKQRGAKVVSICNVVGSSLTRISDGVIYTYAGPEIGVASTKAYTAQLMMLYLISIYLGRLRGEISLKEKKRSVAALKKIPHQLEHILKNKGNIIKAANRHLNFGCFLYLGRNINFPTALEGALKLKEISYIPAEGYAAGEMKHGPIALIDEYRAVVCIAINSRIYEKMLSNIEEIRARKGKVLAVATEGNDAIKSHANEVIYIPRIDETFSPLLAILPLQLFAYYIAVGRNCDVDQPRNLAKSVTVE
ncbi:MAG: glutamine--fructose-6-phosphate transaminase (isomerizing) [Candidatus Omnitrophica bacterium]|nr:glutamine--fructose-6-phosphate transaminase (isomerizing) [Candidatus Omnitrophota bacterium]